MPEGSLVTRIEIKGAEEARRTLMDFYEAFKMGAEDTKALSKELRGVTAPIYGMRRALSAIRTEWRMQHAAWIEGARVMRDIGRIGKTLTSMWSAYTMGMLRVEQAQRGIVDAQGNVRKASLSTAEAQERYNKYLEVFGEDSVYTIDALDDLNEAHAYEEKMLKQEQDAIEAANRAQADMTAGSITMALNFATVGAEIITAIGHFKTLKEILMSAKGAVTEFGSALAGLGGAGGLAVSAGIIAPFAGIAIEAIRTGEEMRAAQMALPEEERIGAYRAPREALQRLVTREFGGFLPETGWFYGHKGEEVVSAPIARMRGRGERGVTVRHVQITQNIANVSSDVDITRMADQSYRKLMRKLERIR